jgi:hypothetical protein
MTYVARRLLALIPLGPRSFLSIGMLEAFAATARHGRSLAPRRRRDRPNRHGAKIGVYLVV